MQFNAHSRAIKGIMTGSGAAIGMAFTHQPLTWVAIAGLSGFVLGCLTAKWSLRS